jgi:acetate kinase
VAGQVLVLNCGSSSVKYQLLAGESAIAGGVVEHIGEPGSEMPDQESALRHVLGEIEGTHLDRDRLAAVGHRVVHGGRDFTAPTRIDDAVVAAIQALVPLAPLHNPANLTGIEVARRLLPRVPQVAVFDTAFHRSMPPAAATYAIDAGLADRLGIQRYGFHGTSHAYVSRRTAALLGRTAANVVTLHLGNGASACAVRQGRSIATSMGMSPLAGLVMGTRCGDLDPAVALDLQRRAGLTVEEVDEVLNHRSGLLGLCGDNDMRAVLARRADGDGAARLAFDVYCQRVKGYLGAYAALLGELDAVTFTAGVGENAPDVRAEVCSNLDLFGIRLDPERNRAPGHEERVISADSSRVAVCVVPTDEEREIATQVLALLNDAPGDP